MTVLADIIKTVFFITDFVEMLFYESIHVESCIIDILMYIKYILYNLLKMTRNVLMLVLDFRLLQTLFSYVTVPAPILFVIRLFTMQYVLSLFTIIL